MEGTGRARGRARGRANADAQPQAPVRAPGQPQAAQQGAGRARGWGPAETVPLQQVHAELSLTQVVSQLKLDGNGSNGNNGDSSTNGSDGNVGRGVVRARREMVSLVETRPASITDKKGTSGQPCNIVANYFVLKKQAEWNLCMYHVDFLPNEERTKERKQLLRQHKEYLGMYYIFDGMILYLPRKLAQQNMELTSVREGDETPFKIVLRFTKELNGHDQQFLQIMGILLRRCMEHMGLQLLGRNYFNSKMESRVERHQIAVWPGFSMSIRQQEYEFMLNVDLQHKFLRTDTAYDEIKRCGSSKDDAYKNLLGQIVLTKYNEKTYRIDDIDWDMSVQSKFPYRGGETTFMQYYETKYQVKIRDPRQPMLMSKPKKRDMRRGQTGNIMLVPELCCMTGLTDQMRADFNMMKDLAQFLKVSPDRRVESLMKFNKSLHDNKEAREEFNHYGLDVDTNLVRLQARTLPFEQLKFGGQIVTVTPKADWKSASRGKVNQPMSLENWAMLFPQSVMNEAQGFFNALQRVGQGLGMKISQPTVCQMAGGNARDYINAINGLQGKTFIMCILMTNRLDVYSAIKRLLSVQLGIPSQCVLKRTISRPDRVLSVATNVALQVNIKLGGELWNATVPVKESMVIGYDTYHDKINRGASYGAVVASYNANWTAYLGQVARHKDQEELSDNFTIGIRNALLHYRNKNGSLPKIILVYRDGVGEGQLTFVKEHEVEAVKDTLKKAYESVGQPLPRMSFIVVSKRINSRFMEVNGTRISNVRPGTIVDDVVTLPERYDFYLVAQHTHEGTVAPTSFNIIEDSTTLTPDQQQRLAYKLTHLYFNWMGTVRVPAPCLYAHKLAYMSGQATNDSPHQNLTDTLWYL